MKKTWIALLAACVLLAVSLSALGEAAPAYEPLNFGDFSMAIDPEMAYSGTPSEKPVDSQVWFMLFPVHNVNGNDRINFNVVWTSNVADVTTITGAEESYKATLQQSVSSQYAAQGITLSSFSVPFIQTQDLNGKTALAYIMISELNVNGETATVYQLQAIVSEEGMGTYTFTGSANTMEELETWIDPLFDSITWNK
jgi:hypothetical protein